MEISVIIPVYNEKDNIKPMIEKVENALKKQFKNYEIIYVNDGSTDGSEEILNSIAKTNKNVKVFHFTENNGQTAALAAGFEKCNGDLVVTMDGDMQTDPEDIYVLLPYIKEYDVVNGKRATREDGFSRKLASQLGNGIRNFITNDNITDTGCPLKLFKKEVVKKFQLFNGMHRFLPTLAKIYGHSVIEVPVRHYDRQFGTSKYKTWGRALRGLKDALAVRWMKSRVLMYKIKED
ncbi:glycosyltransferase involved in cell wall biosynthesis [Hypnocyclicus thermotrophus]|uniref:Glycosyltransferase involved in cell wall biosynthesis n=2 Tax=Hypnocyclicus thermotrophus TaxID=1627895 RepID=A0AA46DX98_9FUSO|nr:glycosyltransferase involved in cell wall biosynthesis [Hypnocyclicus thermotrophus]